METLVSRFEYFAKNTPDKQAVTMGGCGWTYAQLNARANQLAIILKGRGAKPFDVIAIIGEKSLEMVASLLAVLKLQCCYMPIDVNLPAQKIELMIASSQAKLVLYHNITNNLLNSFKVDSINISEVDFNEEIVFKNLRLPIDADCPAYVMHTSGSTGKPKAIVVPHRALIRLLVDTNYIELSSADSVLFHSATSFDAAIFEIWAALLNGARLVIAEHRLGDLLAIFSLCKKEGITILLLTTGLFHIFSTMNLHELTALRYLVVGGDVMHSSAVKRCFEKNQQIKIINGYGPAENAVFTTCYVMSSQTPVPDVVPIGKPIKNTSVYLLDEQLQPVNVGEVGELYTAGQGVALGYLNNAPLTADKFLQISQLPCAGVFYRTGDLARMLPSGDFDFVGRIDNQIKIRGFRVELAEIESLISSLNFVEDVAVFAYGDKVKQIVALVKVAKEQYPFCKDSATTILEYLKAKLPAYSLPAKIEIKDNFPVTINGKIDRKNMQSFLMC